MVIQTFYSILLCTKSTKIKNKFKCYLSDVEVQLTQAEFLQEYYISIKFTAYIRV